MASLIIDKYFNVWMLGVCERKVSVLNNQKTQIDGNTTKIQLLPDIQSVSCGNKYSVFLDTDGSVWVWSYGNARNGYYYQHVPIDYVDICGPTKIASIPCIVKISSGYSHLLFLDINEKIWSYGESGEGALGLGDYVGTNLPSIIKSLSSIISISCGREHSLFLDAKGFVWSCGCNEDGQLGIGDWKKKEYPVKILSLPNIISISGGGYHSLFLDVDCNLWSSGFNEYGQLGLKNNKTENIPVKIPSLSKFMAISAGCNATASIIFRY